MGRIGRSFQLVGQSHRILLRGTCYAPGGARSSMIDWTGFFANGIPGGARRHRPLPSLGGAHTQVRNMSPAAEAIAGRFTAAQPRLTVR